MVKKINKKLLASLTGSMNLTKKSTGKSAAKSTGVNSLLKNHSTKSATEATDFIPGSWHAQHPQVIKWLKILFWPIINPWCRYSLLLVLLLLIVGAIYLLQQLPSPTRLTSQDNYAVSTQIFDRHGELLYEIFADQNRTPIKLADLPAYVPQAAIAIEDKNFYHHWGFDIQGIVRALRNNFTKESSLAGGSTITQQLVKNALLTSEKTLQRKLKEAFLAILTELFYTKQEILELYLNYIAYGGTSVGIEAASRRYFDKSAADLSLAEAALLAGLPQAPSRYSPFGSNPEQAKNRQAEVLRRMVEDGYITAAAAEEAKTQVLKYALSQTEIKAPHFVFYVRDLLYEKYGETQVETGGLRVHTSLDLGLQQAAQATVSAEITKLTNYKVGNGATIITKPKTGEILAMVGSRDYFDTEHDGQVNVTLALRQPGSSIKPLMYATAFQEKAINPGTLMLDIPTCFKVAGQPDYCPKNYDGTFKGAVTIRQSLGNSLNIPAVKALSTIGVKKFIDQATKMGITTWTDPANYGLSLTLGGGEVTMVDLAQAYGTLANQGVKVPLTPILKIEDYQGKVLEEVDLKARTEDFDYLTNYENDGRSGDLRRVMDRAPAYLTSHIMQDNQARVMAFGSQSKLVIKDQVVSAKTGTTNDMKDNWTLGFTPEYLTIVWVGNNDSQPMGRLASGITGAAPIFHDLMSYLLANQAPAWQEKPVDVASAPVCASGFPPTKQEPCATKQAELYWTKGRPSASKYIKQSLWINPATGLPPAEGESTDGLVLQEKNVLQDPVTSGYCQDCSHQYTVPANGTTPATVKTERYSIEVKDGKAVQTTN